MLVDLARLRMNKDIYKDGRGGNGRESRHNEVSSPFGMFGMLHARNGTERRPPASYPPKILVLVVARPRREATPINATGKATTLTLLPLLTYVAPFFRTRAWEKGGGKAIALGRRACAGGGVGVQTRVIRQCGLPPPHVGSLLLLVIFSAFSCRSRANFLRLHNHRHEGALYTLATRYGTG